MARMTSIQRDEIQAEVGRLNALPLRAKAANGFMYLVPEDYRGFTPWEAARASISLKSGATEGAMWAVVETGQINFGWPVLMPGLVKCDPAPEHVAALQEAALAHLLREQKELNERAEYGRALQSGNGEDD